MKHELSLIDPPRDHIGSGEKGPNCRDEALRSNTHHSKAQAASDLPIQDCRELPASDSLDKEDLQLTPSGNQNVFSESTTHHLNNTSRSSARHTEYEDSGYAYTRISSLHQGQPHSALRHVSLLAPQRVRKTYKMRRQPQPRTTVPTKKRRLPVGQLAMTCYDSTSKALDCLQVRTNPLLEEEPDSGWAAGSKSYCVSPPASQRPQALQNLCPHEHDTGTTSSDLKRPRTNSNLRMSSSCAKPVYHHATTKSLANIPVGEGFSDSERRISSRRGQMFMSRKVPQNKPMLQVTSATV